MYSGKQHYLECMQKSDVKMTDGLGMMLLFEFSHIWIDNVKETNMIKIYEEKKKKSLNQMTKKKEFWEKTMNEMYQCIVILLHPNYFILWYWMFLYWTSRLLKRITALADQWEWTMRCENPTLQSRNAHSVGTFDLRFAGHVIG